MPFWDNWTDNIDAIQSEWNDFKWDFIIANWKKISYPLTKYKPYDINILTSKYKWVDKIEQARLLQEYKDYNINYFTKLLWKID